MHFLSQIVSSGMLAGIGWEPEIRGALTVVLASAVLMGSIWGILVTNTGVRLGSLIAIAGFFGWMFIMGIIWWIYGIGYAGSQPTWHVSEINNDPAGWEDVGIQSAVIGNVGDLPDTNCAGGPAPFPPTESSLAQATVNVPDGCTPRAMDLLMAYDGEARELILQELLNPQLPENKLPQIIEDGITDPDAQFLELITRSESEVANNFITRNDSIGEGDPRYLAGSDLTDGIQVLHERRDLRFNALSLSALDAVGPQVTADAADQGLLDLNGWNLLSTAESGEAVASAQAVVEEEGVFDGHEVIVLDAFQQGGKPLLADADNANFIERAIHRVRDALRIKNPTNYTVVQMQVAIDKEVVPGQLPPVPEIDAEAATVSVIMERDLGNLRLVPALVTLFSLLLFLASCLALHYRDQELIRRLAAAPAGA